MRILASLLTLLLLAAPAWAATLSVPGDFASATAAVAAAGPGDTIVLGAGTFSAATTGETFPLTITADGLEIVGQGMGVTILDAAFAATVIEINAPTAKVADLTITGGNADWGGGINIAQGTPEIARVWLQDNSAKLRGSGINAYNDAAPWIHHCVIWRNFDNNLTHGGDPHGIQLGGTSMAVVENNLIGYTDSNGLFYQEQSAPLVRNNIFYINGTIGERGRGICALGATNATVQYNLFWDNAIAAIVMRDPQGGTINVTGQEANDLVLDDNIDFNLDGDPNLKDPAGDVVCLTAGSPAIDAGDPASPLDPDGTRADIGPFFFDQSVSSVPNANRVVELLPNVPNPFNPATTVRLRLEQPSTVEVTILDVRGRRVRSLFSGRMPMGAGTLQWDGRDDSGREVVSGVYTARVVSVDGVQGRPMVLLR